MDIDHEVHVNTHASRDSRRSHAHAATIFALTCTKQNACNIHPNLQILQNSMETEIYREKN